MNIKKCDIWCGSLCTNNNEPAVDSDCNYEIIKCPKVEKFLGFPENKQQFEKDSAYAATMMKSFCNQQQQRKGGNTNKKQRRKRRNTKKKNRRRSNKKK